MSAARAPAVVIIGDLHWSDQTTARRPGLVRVVRRQERFPSWSPDGRRIAYQRHIEYDPSNPFDSGLSDSEIYTMRPDGSGATNLTDNEAVRPPIGDIMPDWGPTPR